MLSSRSGGGSPASPAHGRTSPSWSDATALGFRSRSPRRLSRRRVNGRRSRGDLRRERAKEGTRGVAAERTALSQGLRVGGDRDGARRHRGSVPRGQRLALQDRRLPSRTSWSEDLSGDHPSRRPRSRPRVPRAVAPGLDPVLPVGEALLRRRRRASSGSCSASRWSARATGRRCISSARSRTSHSGSAPRPSATGCRSSSITRRSSRRSAASRAASRTISTTC